MSLTRINSFRARLGFALQGLAHAARAERSCRCSWWLSQPRWLRSVFCARARCGGRWCCGPSAGVIAAELFNTAIEGLADG